jgi:hypothetical protein
MLYVLKCLINNDMIISGLTQFVCGFYSCVRIDKASDNLQIDNKEREI